MIVEFWVFSTLNLIIEMKNAISWAIKDSFEKLRSWGFQNCPWYWKLNKNWAYSEHLLIAILHFTLYQAGNIDFEKLGSEKCNYLWIYKSDRNLWVLKIILRTLSISLRPFLDTTMQNKITTWICLQKSMKFQKEKI